MMRTEECQRSCAHASDRARSDFDGPDAAFVDAEFGVDGAVRQTYGADCLRGAAMDRCLLLDREAGRRDVNRFLEERSVERIGLIENCQSF